jgi:hypothetical protein
MEPKKRIGRDAARQVVWPKKNERIKIPPGGLGGVAVIPLRWFRQLSDSRTHATASQFVLSIRTKQFPGMRFIHFPTSEDHLQVAQLLALRRWA